MQFYNPTNVLKTCENDRKIIIMNTSCCFAVTCPQPEAIEHGTVTTNGLGVGSTAEYSCDEGYALVGDRERRCELDEGSSGVWSGQPPQCILQK